MNFTHKQLKYTAWIIACGMLRKAADMLDQQPELMERFNGDQRAIIRKEMQQIAENIDPDGIEPLDEA